MLRTRRKLRLVWLSKEQPVNGLKMEIAELYLKYYLQLE